MTAKNQARHLLPLPKDNAVKFGRCLVAVRKACPTRQLLCRRLAALPPKCNPAVRSCAHSRGGVHPEHREYPRATLKLPLRLRSVNNVPRNLQ